MSLFAFGWPGWPFWGPYGVPLVSFCCLFWSKNVTKTMCFCMFLLRAPSGVSLVSFACFWLAWVAIWGPHGIPMGSYWGSFCSLCGACGDLWDPFGSLWAPIFCFWGPSGDPVGSLGIFLDPLGDLLEALWDSVASLWEFPWNPWGLPGLPQRGRSPLGQTRLWITCDSLGVLGGSALKVGGDPLRPKRTAT